MPVALPLRRDRGGHSCVGIVVVLLPPVVPPESDGGGAVRAALKVIPAAIGRHAVAGNVGAVAGADPVRLLLVLVVQHGLKRKMRVHSEVMCKLITRAGEGIFVNRFQRITLLPSKISTALLLLDL